MALIATANVDLVNILTQGNYPNDGGELASIVNDGTGDQTVQPMIYYDRLDVLISNWNPNTTLTPSIEWVRLDPLFVANAGSLFGAVQEPGTIGGDNVESIVAGEWDQQANVQKVYVYRAAGGAGFHEVNPLQLNLEINANAFPNLGPDGTQGAGPGVGVEGHVDNVDGGYAIFETWGFAVCTCCRVTLAGAVTRDRVMALIDLSTGAGTILASPVAYGTVSHEFGEAQLFGQNVEFQFIQFVPDRTLSTPSAPRGRLFLSAPGGSNPSDAGLQRTWLKVIDWNPLGVAGTPNRIHLRERLLSAIDLDKGNPTALNGVHPAVNRNYRWFFHPNSNRTFLFSGDGVSDPMVAGENKVIFISSAPALSEITEPANQSDVATGRITRFYSDALGTLEEKIAGVDVQGVLLRESTVDEVLAVTPSAGETVALAQTVSPTDPNLSPIVVKKDGTPLTEGVHYNLDRPNSEIDFIGPEPVGGSIYTATYRHFGDPAAPPHGVLLNQFSTTDQDGRAVFEVEKAEEDPVDDRWDSLDVTAV